MASLPAPMSSGRLIEVSGVARDSWVPARPVRSAAARPPGPDSVSMARPSRARASRPRPARFSGRWVAPANAPVSRPQRGPVDVAGDDRDDGRVAGRGLGFGAGQPARPALASPAVADLRGHPGPFGGRRAWHVAQVGQPEVDVDLGGLATAGGQRAGGDQPPAGVFQRVVAALRGGPGVLRAGLLTQRLQHRGQRGRAARAQVTLRPPSPAERDAQMEIPVPEAVLAVFVGAAGALVDGLSQAA